MKLSGPATNQRRSRSPKRARWPGPLQRKVRRRGDGPQAPEPSTTCAPGGPRRRRSGDRATATIADGAPAPPAAGDRPIQISASPDAASGAHARLPSRLTLKLSGPATDREPSRYRNAPCGRVRCSARLGGATDGPQAPHAIADGRASGFRRRGSGDRATTRRSPTGHRRRPQQGTDRYGYRRRRMPRAEAHAPLAEPANDEAQRTGHIPATIAFPKRALWPGPLQRQVRRRDHGPQAPHALADVRARRPATAGQRRPRNDKALADGAPAPPAAGDRPIWISAPPDAASRSARPVARAG